MNKLASATVCRFFRAMARGSTRSHPGEGRAAVLPDVLFLTVAVLSPLLAQSPERGVAACLPCHRDVFDTYIQAAHFRTSVLASPKSIRGSFAEGENVLRTGEAGTSFRMERRGDDFYQTSDNNGKTRSEKFDLVVGSGRRGQSYLYWRDGLLYQLPVSYWTATDSWINSPGYLDGIVHFDRVVPPRCLECHAAYFPLRVNQAKQMEYGGNYILGLSCRNCHRESGKHAFEAKPAALARERQVDVCALCHSGLRDNQRLPFSYQPGEDLNHYLTPESARAKPDVHGNQVGLLQRSKCYRASEMTCSTCHNVHTVERDLAIQSGKCLQCHEAAQCGLSSQLGSRITTECVSCHMPSESSEVIFFNTSGEQEFQSYRNHDIAIYRDVARRVLSSMAQDP
jgi:predicted CXXCH cytochrome family protein